MAIYAYADETIFTKDTTANGLALGCGLLLSKEEIKQNIIDEALSNLANDNDLNNKDSRNLERRFFHSSEDSPNAHSYLCRSINKYVKGIFDYSYIDNIKQLDASKSVFRERIFNRCLSNSTLELFQSSDEVFLIIEKRNGINEEILNVFQRKLSESHEISTYDIPSFKTYYPRLNIFLRGKEEPGLQIVDFLMWAANRTQTSKPNDVWQKRLQYKTWFSYRDDKNQTRSQYYLNNAPDYNDNSWIVDYPYKFEKYEKWDDFLNAYVLIEKFLVHIERSDFQERNVHLFADFEHSSSKLKNIDYFLNNNDLREIGSIYLRLFDTLPIYAYIANENKEAWKVLLNSKYLASMFLRSNQMHFNRTQDAILSWRYHMQTENANKFRELIY